MADISDGLSHLHMRYYGKGPTRARTHVIDDTVVCVLWEGFTAVEETLIAHGEGPAVERLRHAFQGVMEDRFTAIVEDATGRTVDVYMSQVHVAPNVAVELFLLAPVP